MFNEGSNKYTYKDVVLREEEYHQEYVNKRRERLARNSGEHFLEVLATCADPYNVQVFTSKIDKIFATKPLIEQCNVLSADEKIKLNEIHDKYIGFYRMFMGNIAQAEHYLEGFMPEGANLASCYENAFRALKLSPEKFFRAYISEMLLKIMRFPKAQSFIIDHVHKNLFNIANDYFAANGIDVVYTAKTFSDEFRRANTAPLSMQQLVAQAYAILHASDAALTGETGIELQEMNAHTKSLFLYTGNLLYKSYEIIPGTLTIDAVHTLGLEMAHTDKFATDFAKFKTGPYPQSNAENDRDGAVVLFNSLLGNASSIEEIAALLIVAETYVNRHRNYFIDNLRDAENTNTWKTALSQARAKGLVKLGEKMHSGSPATNGTLLVYRNKLPLFGRHVNESWIQGAFGNTNAQSVIDMCMRNK